MSAGLHFRVLDDHGGVLIEQYIENLDLVREAAVAAAEKVHERSGEQMQVMDDEGVLFPAGVWVTVWEASW